ncbi:hypothetical protein DJ68_08855 [Halorubrum sp. C3]|nr:hypothetical protein DJ68_08855 [Halorubrum sp. C3]
MEGSIAGPLCGLLQNVLVELADLPRQRRVVWGVARTEPSCRCDLWVITEAFFEIAVAIIEEFAKDSRTVPRPAVFVERLPICD